MRELTRFLHVQNLLFPRKLYSRSNVRYQTKQATADPQTVDYCADIVRRYDYENFLATLLMTSAIRSPALVVRAFNVEVARVQDQTTDAHTAAFRLQFWLDTINSIYKNDQTLKNIPANPIARELFKVCCCYSLPKRHLEKLITSRRNLLKTKHFLSLEEVEKYAEESTSQIYYLLLKVAGVENVHADHAASHLGKAQGITNILRSIFMSNHHKMVSIPMDVLMKHKVSQENVLREEDSESMRNVAFEVACRANSQLQKVYILSWQWDDVSSSVKKARSIQVPKTASQIFLPAVATNSYLDKLQKCNFNMFDKSLRTGNAWLPVRLYYHKFLNKF